MNTQHGQVRSLCPTLDFTRIYPSAAIVASVSSNDVASSLKAPNAPLKKLLTLILCSLSLNCSIVSRMCQETQRINLLRKFWNMALHDVM